MADLDSSFKYITANISSDLELVRFISHLTAEKVLNPFAGRLWKPDFVNAVRSFYSNLLNQPINCPTLNYHWGIFDGEFFYRQECRFLTGAMSRFQDRVNIIQAIRVGQNSIVSDCVREKDGKRFIYKKFNFGGGRDCSSEYSREFYTSIHVDHPYFIKSQGTIYNEKDRIQAIIYERIDGMNSIDFARKATIDQLKLITAQLFLGLEYLHSNHIIHGDINPKNVFIDFTGTVKIIEFGSSSIPFVTYSYVYYNRSRTTIAPERVKCVPGGITEASDWWSFGSTVGIWFGLSREFRDENSERFFIPMLLNESGNVYQVGKVPPKFPLELRNFLAIFFQPDPKDRRFITPRQLQRIRDDPFFEGIDWSSLEGGLLKFPNRKF